MAAIKQRQALANGLGENEEDPGVDAMTREEGVALFDRKARQLIGMSGAEFLQRWDAGELRPVPDTADGRKIGRLVMLIPFARRTPD